MKWQLYWAGFGGVLLLVISIFHLRIAFDLTRAQQNASIMKTVSSSRVVDRANGAEKDPEAVWVKVNKALRQTVVLLLERDVIYGKLYFVCAAVELPLAVALLGSVITSLRRAMPRNKGSSSA